MCLVYVAKFDSRGCCAGYFHEKTLETDGGYPSAAHGGADSHLQPREELKDAEGCSQRRVCVALRHEITHILTLKSKV